MKLDSKTASFYYSRPSEWLGGRRAVVPCAHILGGGSSINFMMYTRASASDYDDFQAKGWTTKELIPLMKKHETYQRASNNREIHGFEGPIKVSFGNYTYPIMQDFLRAVESQDIPVTDDLQDLVTGHGAEHWLKWINRYESIPEFTPVLILTRLTVTLAVVQTPPTDISTALVHTTRTCTLSSTPSVRRSFLRATELWVLRSARPSLCLQASNNPESTRLASKSSCLAAL